MDKFLIRFDSVINGVFHAGIPPDQCQLPLEPVIPAEMPDSIRFGTEPESRYEFNSFPRVVSSQYVTYCHTTTCDWTKFCHVTCNITLTQLKTLKVKVWTPTLAISLLTRVSPMSDQHCFTISAD